MCYSTVVNGGVCVCYKVCVSPINVARPMVSLVLMLSVSVPCLC